MGEYDQRWGMIYPHDGEEAPADGKTKSRPSDLRVDATDYGDVIQALIWLRNQHDGAVGDLADRPAAGADAPRTYTTLGVTDSAPTIYFNDESVPEWTAISVGDADTLDGLDSTQFLRSDASDTWKGSTFTFEGPDDTSGTVAIERGADTGAAGTPSIDTRIDGDVTVTSGTLSVDPAGTGAALDTNGGDITNLDDIVFATGATPRIHDLDSIAGGIAGTDAAGNRQIISSLWGDAGEYVQLGSTGSGAGSPSTTSTTFVNILFDNQVGVVPGDRPTPTNIDTYAISGVLEVGNDTAGETTTVRIRDTTNAVSFPGTEVTHTGTGFSRHHTPIVTHAPGNAWAFNFEAKVTAGTGTVQANPTVILWGRIA